MGHDEPLPVGVGVHSSFPNPPSVETLTERLARPVQRVERTPTVLFTDDPAATDAPVVVTTEPAVASDVNDETTVVRWTPENPPWAFLTAALPDDANRSADAASDSRDSASFGDGGSPAGLDAGTHTEPETPAERDAGTHTEPETPADREGVVNRPDGGCVSPGGEDAVSDATGAGDRTRKVTRRTGSATDRPRPVNAWTRDARGSGDDVRPADDPKPADGVRPADDVTPPNDLVGSLDDPAVIVAVDGQTRIVSVNDAFVRFADGPIVGRPPIELDGRLPDPVVERLRAAIDRAHADERGPSGQELRLDGLGSHYVTHDMPYETADGTRSLVVFTDVTGLKRRETQTDVLTRILRHDLRNEVTVLRGWAEQITSLTDDERVVAAAERIVDAAGTLDSVGRTAGSVQAVLTDPETRWTVHDAGELLGRVAERVSARYPDASISVERVDPEQVVATYHLERALVEVTENAVSHTADATARLSASVEGDQIRLAVSDDGNGIPDTEWEVVANSQEITQLHHASGLGLWLARWIAENNGGRLERDERHDDTTVSVYLPHAGSE